MKTFLFRSMIGIFLGAFLAVVTVNAIVVFGNKEVLDGEIFLKNSLGFIFCGWFFSITPLFFELQSLRLSQQTALHFVTVAILFAALSFGIGWFPFNSISILIFTSIFLVMYVINWIGFYLYFKHEAKKLDEELRKI